MNRDFLKLTLKMLALTVGSIVACRYSSGVFLVVLFCFGCWCALVGRIGWFMVIYLLIVVLSFSNPMILPRTSILLLTLRFASFTMSVLLLFRGISSRSRHVLPLGAIFIYLGVMVISSATGWCPAISYLKLVFFALFMLALTVGSRAIAGAPSQLRLVRAFLLAFSIYLVFGSMATIPFPNVANLSAQMLIRAGRDAKEVELLMKNGETIGLFCGVTCHSQYLGPILSCTIGWVLCDMFCVVRRISKWHLAIFAGALPLLYLTRSRVALVSFAFMVVMVYGYCLRVVKLDHRVRNRVKSAMLGLVVLIALFGVVEELRTNKISKWLRKTDDVKGDSRSLGEALTSSRQGAIEANLDDFRKNIMFGMGFQVTPEIGDNYRIGHQSLLSAPIEKGLLPMIVLGEGGVSGAFAFLVFLVCFFSVANHNKYHVTVTLFAVYLMTNMAEGNFFSPTGGAPGWLITVLGGFTIDMIVLQNANRILPGNRTAVMYPQGQLW